MFFVCFKSMLKKSRVVSKKEHSFVHNLGKNLSNARTMVCFLFEHNL